jgi:hypothetical protein
MILVENLPVRREAPLRRRIEMTKMEVFLDFDPVFPGWPPMDAAEKKGPATTERNENRWEASSSARSKFDVSRP